MASNITIAHIYAKKYAYEFEVHSGNIYKKSVPHIVDSVLKDGSQMSLGSDKDSLILGEYFFDDLTLTLYVYDASIDDSEYLLTYKLLFSTGPIELSHDLSDSGTIYDYIPRLTVTSAFSTKIDGSAVGTALIGAGSIKLENTDGYFNDWYCYYFENQKANLYNIINNSPTLIYEGVITGKDFDRNSLNIKISNELNIISKSVESDTISDVTDGLVSLNDTVRGIYRNRIWGRVDGVKGQSLDVNPEIYELTGTLSIASASASVTGTGTQFLSEISSGDTLLVGDSDYTVIDVISDTSLTLSEDSTTTFSGKVSVEYSVVNPTFNRVWSISAKALREANINIVGQSATTIFELEGGRDDLIIGDIVLYYSDSEDEFYLRTVESLFANNVVLNQAIPITYGSGDYIVRLPIQRCYHNYKEVNVHPDTISVTNNTNGCYVTLARNFEFYTGTKKYIDASGEWSGTIGQNYITRAAISESILDTLAPRNYLIFNGVEYEVCSVITTEALTTIRFTNTLASAVSQNGLNAVIVSPLEFDSTISFDVIGETIDGEKDGVWIKTGIQFLKQQLIEGGLENKLSTNLDLVDQKNNQRISLIAPISPGQKKMPKLKALIDQLNNSLFGSLFINNSFEFDYKLIDYSFDYSNAPTFIEEYDLIDWSSKTERNDLFAKANYSYNVKQIDHLTEEDGESIFSSEGELASLLGLVNTTNFTTCFYDEIDARCAANRKLFLSTLLNSTISIKTDLRFDHLNLLDMVELSLNNYPKLVDSTKSRYMLVLSIKKTEDSLSIVLGDVGSSINRRSLITPDSFLDYASAENIEIIKSSYITNELGLTGDEETKGFNLII